MVKILANGDIVPDDDPRAKGSTANNSRQRIAPPQRGGIPSATDNQQFQGGAQVSIFQTINQRLLGLGIPRWNIGDTVIEPIVSVGLVLAVIMFGIPGLLFGALLFAVSQWSSNGPPDFVAGLLGTRRQQGSQNNQGRGDSNRRGGSSGGGGGGHRLGRN